MAVPGAGGDRERCRGPSRACVTSLGVAEKTRRILLFYASRSGKLHHVACATSQAAPPSPTGDNGICGLPPSAPTRLPKP